MRQLFLALATPRTIWATAFATVSLLQAPHTFAAIQPTAPQQQSLGLFDVYEQNRTQGIPNLITPDFLLVSYSLLRESTNTQVEATKIKPEFQKIVVKLQETLANNPTKDIAKEKAGLFVSLLQALLEGKVLADTDNELLRAEVVLVNEAKGIALSPLLGIKIDYSQFKPRGRYTRDEKTANYFRAFKYASSAHFFTQASPATGVSPEKAAELTAIAHVLSTALASIPELKTAYQNLIASLSWEYGKSVDLAASDFWVLDNAKTTNWQDPQATSTAILAYATSQKKLPQIFDVPVDSSKLKADEKIADVVVGWRFIPSTLTNDIAATQTMIYPQTGQFSAPCGAINCVQPWTLGSVDGKPVKSYMRAVELFSIMGLPKAIELTEFGGENLFANYVVAQQAAKQILEQPNGLNQLQIDFMRSSANQGIKLEPLLGFWTWQRYINILYSKQSMGVSNKSIAPPEQQRVGAKLQGSAPFYQQLAKLVEQHHKQVPLVQWQEFLAVVQNLQKIADKKSPLLANEEAFLNDLDKTLLRLTGGKDKPIVVDVHTNPIDKVVVEEAIGLPRMIQDNKARGAVLSYHEFKQPMDQRMDNAMWQKALLQPQIKE